MKRIISAFFISVLLFALGSPVRALADPTLASHPDTYVTDYAGLLTAEEILWLDSELKVLSDELDFDIVVVTTHDLEGKSPAAYCDDFYDYSGYGRGDVFSGICFLRYITEDGSDYEVYISTCGLGLIYFNDSAINDQIDYIADYIISGRYYEAFSYFAENAASHVRSYNASHPNELSEYEEWKKTNGPDKDGFYRTEDYLDWKAQKEYMRYKPSWIVFAVIAGLIVGGIATASMKKQLISVSTATDATEYVRKGSFRLTGQTDTFLYKNVSAVPIPRSSSGGGGGTSSHHSSSGRSHGGGGRHI